ncbi:MAG TPA: M20 family metallopeptidase [Streptosporangiaceae bacterium]|nr:M20 family metallopeptidase [Streptosporangiaceae bacterium]
MNDPGRSQQRAVKGGALSIDSDGLVAFTQHLVRTRSVHDPATGATERQAAILVAEKMREFGWEPLIEEVAPGRPNVVAFVTGGGGSGPTLVFEGHTDVVTEGERGDWDSDPYSGEIRNGRLYGRGSADMKSGLAAALYAARAVQFAGPFPGRIAVCALADEEGMMLGAKQLARSGLLADAAGVIVCEPEGGEICTMAKGAIRVKIELRGAMAHGAMPHLGNNPISAASRLLLKLEQLQSTVRAECAMSDGVEAMSMTPTVFLAGAMPQVNVIPSTSVLCLDLRTTPAVDHSGLLARIGDLAAGVTAATGVDITLEVLDDRPAVDISPEHPLVVALAAAHVRVHGAPAPFGIVPGTTDGTILTRDAGLATVVYGPGGKWIAHQADEFVSVAEIGQYAMVYAEAARAFLFDPSNRPGHV